MIARAIAILGAVLYLALFAPVAEPLALGYFGLVLDPIAFALGSRSGILKIVTLTLLAAEVGVIVAPAAARRPTDNGRIGRGRIVV